MPPVLTRNHPTSIDEDTAHDLGPQGSALPTPTLVENPVIPAEPLPLGPASDDLEGAAKNGIHSSVDNYDHFHTWRQPVSKVRPAVYNTEDRNLEGQGEHPFTSSMLLRDVYPVENHFQHSRINTPKVRPLMESPSVKASRIQEDRQLTASSHGESSRPSQVDSQMSLTGVQPANLESDPKQENICRRDEPNKPDSGTSDGHSESKIAPVSSGNSSGRSIASIPPAPRPLSASRNVNAGDESHLPQKLKTRRTSRWLRGLLGLPEVDASPTLTELPEKAPPRPESCDDAGSSVSEVTTYSAENIANKEDMNNAMHSPEYLTTEALSLADNVGKREYGHVDDGNLPLKSTSEYSIHRRSADESLRHSSSEQGGEILASTVSSVPMSLRSLPLQLNSVYPGLGTDNKDHSTGVTKLRPEGILSSSEVREYIQNFHGPPIGARGSSKIPREAKDSAYDDSDSDAINRLSEIRLQDMSVCSLDGGTSDEAIDLPTQNNSSERRRPGLASLRSASRRARDEKYPRNSGKPKKKQTSPVKHTHGLRNISLRNRSHVSIGEGQRFSLTRSARRQPTIARD